MKTKKTIIACVLISIIAVAVFAIGANVFAIETGASGITNPLDPAGKYIEPEVLIGRIIKAALGIVGSIALLMFIYGGFQWLTSMGNAQKVEKGRETIIWAVVGLAIIFISYTAVGFVIKALTGKTENSTSNAPTVILGDCRCEKPTLYIGQNTESECTLNPNHQQCTWTPR